MTAPIDPNLPTSFPKSTRVVYLEANRPPFKGSIGETNLTSSDVKYRDGSFYEGSTEWKDLSNPGIPNIWKLARIVSKTQSQWFLIGGGNGALIQIGVDAATLPGMNPVMTDGNGQINVTGAQIGAGIIGANVIRTHTIALAQFNIEIQQTDTSPTKNTDLNGISHFNENYFTVDEGFVSPNGIGLIETLIPDENFDGSIATPISPQTGNINIFSIIPGIIPVTRTLNSNGLPTGNLTVENRSWISAFVVDPSITPGTRGTFSSINAANTAASTGSLIIIRDGIYIEDFSAKIGVTYAAFSGENLNPNVTIKGKISFSSAGSCTFANIKHETNGDYFLEISGSNASIPNFQNCVLSCSDHDGINNTSSSSAVSINAINCRLAFNSPTFKLFNDNGPGDIVFLDCRGGVSTTYSTKSAGRLSIENCNFFFPIETSGTNQLGIINSNFDTGANITPVIAGGSVTQAIYNSRLDGGNQPALEVSSNCIIFNTILSSTNAVAVSGTGTVNHAALTYENSGINFAGTLTVTTNRSRPGIMRLNGSTGLPGTSTSNDLGIYEEGTWTPTLVGGTTAGTTTYANQVGYYTRIGNLVTCFARIVVTAATGTGDARVSLPFAVRNQANGFVIGAASLSPGNITSWLWPTGTTSIAPEAVNNATFARFPACASGVLSSFLQMNNNQCNFQYSITYEV